MAGVVIAAVFLILNNLSKATTSGSSGFLQNLETQVFLQRRGSGDFVNAAARLDVAQGDVIRTNETGKAELNYFDGSLTRLGANTLFRVIALTDKVGERSVKTQLDVGRSWHRVRELTTSGDRFEVRTSNAVAAVRGTVFMVDCTANECVFTVVEGVVEVTADNGTKTVLNAGEQVTVARDGTIGAQRTVSLPELRATDPWFEFNSARDERADGSGPTTTTTTTPSSTTTTVAGPAGPGGAGPPGGGGTPAPNPAGGGSQGQPADGTGSMTPEPVIDAGGPDPNVSAEPGPPDSPLPPEVPADSVGGDGGGTSGGDLRMGGA